jgi:ubiquitin-protein ligase
MNWERFMYDLRQLSYAYTIVIDDDYKSIIVKNFNLPPGYNRGQIPVMLKIPSNYPESAPGVGRIS